MARTATKHPPAAAFRGRKFGDSIPVYVEGREHSGQIIYQNGHQVHLRVDTLGAWLLKFNRRTGECTNAEGVSLSLAPPPESERAAPVNGDAKPVTVEGDVVITRSPTMRTIPDESAEDRVNHLRDEADLASWTVYGEFLRDRYFDTCETTGRNLARMLMDLGVSITTIESLIRPEPTPPKGVKPAAVPSFDIDVEDADDNADSDLE